jgi:DNA-directed RNA polymerase specialized sigma24 family protein
VALADVDGFVRSRVAGMVRVCVGLGFSVADAQDVARDVLVAAHRHWSRILLAALAERVGPSADRTLDL